MKILLTALLVLVTTMILAGTVNSAFAQDDPSILIKIAKNAQDQIRKNISENSSETIKTLFQEGSSQVDGLILSVNNNNIESAQKHFLSAMKIFKEISQLSSDPQTDKVVKFSEKDTSSDLLKLYRYISSLKIIAENYNISINFTELENLFFIAEKQISEKQFIKAEETTNTIKESVYEIKKQLQDQALQQEPERAQKYAQKYLKQLDKLIASAKGQDISEDIIHQLEKSREDLSLAKDPRDIINQVREINSIKANFELMQNNLLESRIVQTEKLIQKLSDNDKINSMELQEARETLQTIKQHFSENQFEPTNDLLRSLTSQLNEIQMSLS